MGEILLAVTGFHRDQQGHRHSRDGRVHPRIVEQSPHHEGRHQVGEHPLLAHLLHEVDPEHDGQRHQQAADLNRPAVEERDDQNGPQVIGDGQRREEDFERHGNAVAQHREDADGEGDVRGRGDSPAVGGGRTVVEEREDDGRSQHAARGSQHRKNRPPHGRKLSADDLALDFEPHGEEEDHHQPIVDELLDGHAPGEDPVDQSVRRADHQREVGFEQVMIVNLGAGQVGQQHGEDHAREQHYAAGPRSLQKITATKPHHMSLAHPAIHRKQSHLLIRCLVFCSI